MFELPLEVPLVPRIIDRSAGRQVAIIAMAVSTIETVQVSIVSFFFE